MTIDLCEKFKNNNIDGIEHHELLAALEDKSGTFEVRSNGLVAHKPSEKRFVLECAKEYFEPEKSYYKLNRTSRCPYVQRALGVQADVHEDCKQCLASCITRKLRMKPKKIVIPKDYYLK